MRRDDAEPELPIDLGPRSTDEYSPRPLSRLVAEAIRRARDVCETSARRTAVSRREFLRSTCAAATVLLALDACSKEAHRAKGTTPGGTFAIPPEATTETAAADSALGGEEFVFDVQGHLLDHTLDPQAASEFDILAAGFPQRRCGERDPHDCFSIEHFLEEMFVKSDTNMAVLSAVPVPIAHDPLSPAVMEETRRLTHAVCHDDRLVLHGKVAPTHAPIDSVLAGMEALVHEHPIVGWKTYTHLVGAGWWLDDHDARAPQVGEAFIRKAIDLGVPRIAVHKGLVTAPYNTPDDVGPAAKRHPDLQLLVYHAGYQIGAVEGPYSDATAARGSNRLIASLRGAGIAPNQNVFADLGTTWWQVMRNPTQAAHLLGKLLRYVGDDNVLWGTDCIWYGSPQGQIQALRALEISTELQDLYGYPALTKQRKAKILGLNAARVYGIKDPVRARCTFTRRELVELRRRPG